MLIFTKIGIIFTHPVTTGDKQRKHWSKITENNREERKLLPLSLLVSSLSKVEMSLTTRVPEIREIFESESLQLDVVERI